MSAGAPAEPRQPRLGFLQPEAAIEHHAAPVGLHEGRVAAAAAAEPGEAHRGPYLPFEESLPGEYTGIGNCATLPPSAALILLTPCFSTSSTRNTACNGM
jgi:hypothetical protein